MSPSKSKCWYSNNCLCVLKSAVPLCKMLERITQTPSSKLNARKALLYMPQLGVKMQLEKKFNLRN
jgi:hypothetical protein